MVGLLDGVSLAGTESVTHERGKHARGIQRNKEAEGTESNTREGYKATSQEAERAKSTLQK